jgi:hypothetical protein
VRGDGAEGLTKDLEQVHGGNQLITT